jgi:hypothetical protein
MKVKKEPWIIVTEDNGNIFRFNYYHVASVNSINRLVSMGNVREEVILTQTNGREFKFIGNAAKICLEQWEKIVNKEVD